MNQYTFGDTDLAAHRLKVLSEVFDDLTRPFILESIKGRPPLAVDLGCGPGYSTRLLSKQCERVVGLDDSEHFLSLARRTASDRESFFLHDVTTVPFPAEACDLLFCRLLLTHLVEPQSIVSRWASQIRPNGLLLMEEVEWIRTGHGVFSTYLDIIVTMLNSQSHLLYVGPVLDSLEDTEGLKRQSSRVRHLSVPNYRAATMFHLNIQTWKNQPFVKENYSATEIDRLQERLRQLAGKPGPESDIEWGMRQLVFQRR